MKEILEQQLKDLWAMFSEADMEQKLSIANLICKTASVLMQISESE